MSEYSPNTLIPGSVYSVIRLLGQGGMGTVYEVEDTTVGKRYVLKTLHAELRDRRELAARINKEARILAKLSHPNIVDVVTAGMTDDAVRLPYFVMQKLDGHTLRSILTAKGRLPTQTAYSIAIDLLDALDHAHSIGVIHRDVKPENIFLHRGPSGTHQTKLLDFGVMHLLSGEEADADVKFVGTLRYAPPEQLSGGTITPQTDLYATALVLYEMLAGSGPFDDQTTDRQIATAHLEKTPPPLSSCIEISPELDALVMSALSKDPAERPRDAFSFAAKLRELSHAAMSARLAMESLLNEMSVPASATNLDGLRRFSEYPAPVQGVRTVPRSEPRTDRNATTDPMRGSTRSHATHGAPHKSSRGRVLGIVAFAVLLGLSVLAIGGWRKATAAADAPAPTGRARLVSAVTAAPPLRAPAPPSGAGAPPPSSTPSTALAPSSTSSAARRSVADDANAKMPKPPGAGF
jgi:serine/threonine protein kinase